ncbi:MAG TPA: metalloregulator ArsR/SmtB family transcription factor [Solirubrobacterales bacterium]|nr:metalloregulator ArsR/SmtB family transcription factor [Solirubrobacterales bacterium]
MKDERELDELLRALAHPARRRIVALTADRSRTAGELAEATGLSAPATSEHLKVLRKTGLVICRIDGRFRIYESGPGAVERVVNALERLR